MATQSSILVWRIPRTEKAGGLQSMGSQRAMSERLTPFLLSLPPTSHPIPPVLMSLYHGTLRFLSSRSCSFIFLLLAFLSFFSFHLFWKLTFSHLGISLVYYSSFVNDCFWVLPLKENYKSCKRCMWQIWHSVTPIRLPVLGGRFWRKQHESTQLFVSKIRELQAVTFLCLTHIIWISWQKNSVWVCVGESWGHKPGFKLVKF